MGGGSVEQRGRVEQRGQVELEDTDTDTEADEDADGYCKQVNEFGAVVCPGGSMVVGDDGDADDYNRHLKESGAAVSAAVSVVSSSSRRGVVALCASVAHIIRQNYRLQHRVKELEEQLHALTGSTQPYTSPTTPHHSHTCSTTHHHHNNLDSTTHHHSHTSSTQHHSGSDPTLYRENSIDLNRPLECTGSTVQHQNHVGSAAHHNISSTQQHNTSSTHHNTSSTHHHTSSFPPSQRCGSAPPSLPPQASTYVPIQGSSKGGCRALLRGHTRASTGCLGGGCGHGRRRGGFEEGVYDLSMAPAFVRRKNNSISLRRLKGGKTTFATNSSNNDNNNNNKSNTEGDTVKLLAKKLTSVLQEEDNNNNNSNNNNNHQHSEDPVVCAPYPLEGCECDVCLRLSSHTHYQITTESGSLLPQGSTVLVKGRRVGTVLYFGHHALQHTPDPESTSLPAAPLGVKLHLWPPHEGTVFVPLHDVICQLDDEEEGREENEGSSSCTTTTTKTTKEKEKELLDIASPTKETVESKIVTPTELVTNWYYDHDQDPRFLNREEDQNRKVVAEEMSEIGYQRETHYKDYGSQSTDYKEYQNRPSTRIERSETDQRTTFSENHHEKDRSRLEMSGKDPQTIETSDYYFYYNEKHHNSLQPHNRFESRENPIIDGRIPTPLENAYYYYDDKHYDYLQRDNGKEYDCEIGKKPQFGDTWDSGCYSSLSWRRRRDGDRDSESSEQFSEAESHLDHKEEALKIVWSREVNSKHIQQISNDTYC